MTSHVIVLPEAESDLFTIHRYVAEHGFPSRADKLLARLEQACARLERFPHRGHIPPELRRIGITDFLEISVAPYRIIYELAKRAVYVHAVLDDRRDLQELLGERILR